MVAEKFPNVKLVYGSLESSELIEEAAKKADIVFRMGILTAMSFVMDIYTLLVSVSDPEATGR